MAEDSMLRDFLKDADVHTMGMLLESGASGSLHMTFSSDVVRRAIQQPLPPSCSMPGALTSHHLSALQSVPCIVYCNGACQPSPWHAHVPRCLHMLCRYACSHRAELSSAHMPIPLPPCIPTSRDAM